MKILGYYVDELPEYQTKVENMSLLDINPDFKELTEFMNSEDRYVLARMITFFSTSGKYLHPRELKGFWESLTEPEKEYYRSSVEW